MTRPRRWVHGEFTGDGAVSGFIEATDGVRIHLLRWPADARAAVVFLHGTAPRLPIQIPLAPDMYTANPSYLDFVRGDRLRLLTATAQFFWTTAVLDRYRVRAAGRLLLPVLLQGEADAMVDVSASRRWFDEPPAADKTYQAYPGAGRTLDLEPEPDRGRYLTDLRDWLSARASAGP